LVVNISEMEQDIDSRETA